MKLENYRYVVGMATPAYWYEEGKEAEEYYIDSQNLYFHKFSEMSSKEEDNRKWWIISPYVPEHKEKPTKDVIKWLVEDCYKDKDYEFYEWDFKSHCIKTD